MPGSKSITNRALLLATLAKGKSVLRGCLFSEDSAYFLECVRQLGFTVEIEKDTDTVTIQGLGGALPKTEGELYVGSAGTAARFLTALLATTEGRFTMKASEQMSRRPMGPLLQALEELGCRIVCLGEEGHFPFRLEGHGFQKDGISIDIESSSQFLSALLIASPGAKRDFFIEALGHHGMAYVRMTCDMMEQFGVKVLQQGNRFWIKEGAAYQAREYEIEPDASAACYFYGAAALLGAKVLVPGIHFHSLQGDVAFLRILAEMGAVVEDLPEGICVTGPKDGALRGVEADLSACSDQAITLAALAPFADGPVTLRGIGHIRYQESDRMLAIVTELEKRGISCEMGEDWIRIFPGQASPGLVDTYEDHRMAMGFSLMGLKSPGIVIDNPDCCKKTFAEYFTELEKLVQQLC